MTEFTERIVNLRLGYLDIGYWKLFGIWNLNIGI